MADRVWLILSDAPIRNLVLLINREFLVILTVALVVGSAAGYFLADQILSDMYAFRVGLNAVAGLAALAVVVVTAVLTIGSRVYGAATASSAEISSAVINLRTNVGSPL